MSAELIGIIAMGVSLAGLMVGLVAWVRSDLGRLEERLGKRIDQVEEVLGKRIDAVATDEAALAKSVAWMQGAVTQRGGRVYNTGGLVPWGDLELSEEEEEVVRMLRSSARRRAGSDKDRDAG